MSRIQTLAVVRERNSHNAPTRTGIVDVTVDEITRVGGIVVDNRYLTLVEECEPTCHATLTLALRDGTTFDVAAGTHPDPDSAIRAINQLATWLTGSALPSASAERDAAARACPSLNAPRPV